MVSIGGGSGMRAAFRRQRVNIGGGSGTRAAFRRQRVNIGGGSGTRAAFRRQRLQTPTNLLILSLAVSDLLVGLIVIPAMTVAIMQPCWVLGRYFCVLLLYTNCLCCSSSVGNLILISVDRYVAVCDPLMYCMKITIARIKFCIFITWCCCIIYDAVLVNIFVNVQVPIRCFNECIFIEGHFWVNVIDFVITMGIPCSIIITLYLKIFVVARSQARKVFSKSISTVSGVRTVQASKPERKASKTLGIVVFNYLICWNPITFFVSMIFSSQSLTSIVLTFLPFVNSFINPIIYAFFYKWFIVTAKHILSHKLSC
ncbi:trace amine-associated receptor 5-like isoform X2 [Esox lucius]|uniref:trace amine-associated receptor 5-like isoform X2 n=1 Tax=Esox lucius TaxID=8010 RepID=UPI0014774682|nr:trace amine-associated receptor 5-like isoform X2 [Esox lucius]XP_034145074.1 trace amine-associated receptor 5-like isoform X2 [Esox lucius]